MKTKRTISAIVCLLFFGSLYQAQAQSKKYLLSSQRVFPKVSQVLEFEKALAAHAQKYHNGDNHWRVFEIQTGPDFGGYHIVEGPKSWASEDERGDLGQAHTLDWAKNVSIHLTERQSSAYAVYQDSLSTVALGDFSDKIQISHVVPKIGHTDHITAILKKLKKAWEAAGLSVAVYASSSSGQASYTLTTRYKQGYKEKDPNFRKPFKEYYEGIYGAGSYTKYLADVAEHTQENWTELLILKKELSSK